METSTKRAPAPDLCDLLVVLIERLAVLPVEKGGDAHNFFLLVDNRQRQDVLDDEARLVHGRFLRDTRDEKVKL